MTPSEQAILFDVNPTTPFRLTLNSGDTVDVLNPERTLIESIMLIVGQSENPASRIADRIKYVSISNILMIERIDSRRPRGRRNRAG